MSYIRLYMFILQSFRPLHVLCIKHEQKVNFLEHFNKSAKSVHIFEFRLYAQGEGRIGASVFSCSVCAG